VNKQWEPDDWNGGPAVKGADQHPDSWYYYPGCLCQDKLIRRLLMCGTDLDSAVDIARGQVHGLSYPGGGDGMQDVGLSKMGARTPTHD
jgi:hypothetical protein